MDRVVCPKNAELVEFMLKKQKEMVDLSENNAKTISKACSKVCSSKTPIKTLKDFANIKGVGKWILRIMKDFFTDEAENEEMIQSAEASGLPEIGKGKARQFGVSSDRDWYMLTELGKEAARDLCIRDELVDDVASQHVSSSWQKKPVEIPPDTLDKCTFVMSQIIPKLHAEKDARARDLIDRGMKLEVELRDSEPLRADAENEQVVAIKSDIDGMHKDLVDMRGDYEMDASKLKAENEQVVAIKSDIDGMHKDLVDMRGDYEMVKKANEEHMIQKESMEKNLILMAREIEKL
ncbi:hypothetical protein L2E82_38903 [Cichorium intybus]|uniref:Uncharacterized protein n=1 Tax=Cichorium intybus TaxID=13427 RepID=A0ACB9AGI8_CICIN|nr:hypothetical protein L2E82_38903 [Cichorium intybus]